MIPWTTENPQCVNLMCKNVKLQIDWMAILTVDRHSADAWAELLGEHRQTSKQR